VTTTTRQVLPAAVGGRACLDFANTVGPRLPKPGVEPHDYIPGYQELVTWSAQCGLLTAVQQRRLTGAAEADPEGAVAIHQDARRLREATYQAFAAIAHGRQAPQAALATIQDAYVAALRNGRLAAVPAGLDWSWPERGPLGQVLWPLARSAVDLATSGRLARIKQCPGDDGQCGWLFLDNTKSDTRRWCSMRTCGGREKSQRQVARHRAAHPSR